MAWLDASTGILFAQGIKMSLEMEGHILEGFTGYMLNEYSIYIYKELIFAGKRMSIRITY